jgi:predicted AlkP superfamily phosphohydrolase/phosphomutase/tetratricopeptide (TPR) repeat protein
MNKKKVVLIGWDAADWKIITPLLGKGYMPTLNKLVKHGAYGNLSTMNPPYSPMLWTSVATGKTPDKHGVLGFVELDTAQQAVRPVSVTQRKTRALWNIFHHSGIRSNLIGWWPSHPAEPINGNVITDKFAKITGLNAKDWGLTKGSFFPRSLGKVVQEFRIHPTELTEAHILPFIPEAHRIDSEESKSITVLSKILAENSTVHACSTYLMEEKEWDFTAVYYDLIDHISHAFMNYHPPKLPLIPEDSFEIYKDVVVAAYRYQDMMLERTLQLAGKDALVIVMSDHGFVSDNNRMLVKPKMSASPALDHREFGMIAMYGPGVKKNHQIFGCSLLDVAPTILNYFDLPIGRDMDGSVLSDAFESLPEVKYIDSWDDVRGDFGEHQHTIKNDPLSDQAAMEQLIELGYVDRPKEDLAKTILKTKCDIKFNLARVFTGKGDLFKAKELLHELVQENVDTQPYYIDLLNLAIRENDYSLARIYLNKIHSKDGSTARLFIEEAKILMGEGEIGKALNLLEHLSNKESLRGPVRFELGKLYLQIENQKKALEQFQLAVKFQPDKAKYQHALALCYLDLGKTEEALDHVLTAVELIRHFPDAHYTLGRILEKMGEKEEAKRAYEMASRLNQNHKRAKLAINNLAGSQLASEEKKQVDDSDFPEIIIVSGLPRSGTSLMMQMLKAGGVKVLSDNVRKEDVDNPKGYYELEKVKSLPKDNSWMHEAEGQAVKVIAHLLKHLPAGYRYKVILMTRDMDEVLASQLSMIERRNGKPQQGLEIAFKRELDNVKTWSKKEPGVALHEVSFHDVLFAIDSILDNLEAFLQQSLNKEAMKAAVDTKLYRNYSFKRAQEEMRKEHQ